MNPFGVAIKEYKCRNCKKEAMWQDDICRDCFKEQQERKSIEERLLELEITTRLYRNHQHIDLMRF